MAIVFDSRMLCILWSGEVGASLDYVNMLGAIIKLRYGHQITDCG